MTSHVRHDWLKNVYFPNSGVLNEVLGTAFTCILALRVITQAANDKYNNASF